MTFVEFLSNQTARGCVRTCRPAEGEFAALKEDDAGTRKGLKDLKAWTSIYFILW